MVQLFDAATGTIATAHAVNQQGPAREFNSAAEYAGLRDKFIGTLSASAVRHWRAAQNTFAGRSNRRTR
jgi:hypothetical protein